MVEFRALNENEHSDFIEFLQEIFSPDNHQEFAILWQKFLLTNPDKNYWVVIDDYKIVGIAVCHQWKVIPKSKKLNRKYWHLSNFYIGESVRGSGVGKKFLNYILDKAKEEGIEKIIVWAGGESSEFFVKNGFEDENNILVTKL